MMLDEVMSIVEEAGRLTLAFFGKPMDVDYKSDQSPLTKADRQSHRHISARLEALFPNIPVISEEAQVPEFNDRRHWPTFWLVDPLDGTKEFINGRPEYTVNVALIEGGQPVLGVVGVPAHDRCYAARKGGPALCIEGAQRRTLRREHTGSLKGLRIAASRSHAAPAIKELVQRLPDTTLKSVGSALKFCLIAEGAIDFYPRFGPIMEWDTAAAHCVVEGAGGVVRQLDGIQPLGYNKPVVKHFGFMVSASEALNQAMTPLIADVRQMGN